MAAKKTATRKATARGAAGRPADVVIDAYSVARFAELVHLDRHTLAGRIAEMGIVASGRRGGATVYHLRDLLKAALGGDIEAERLRKTREEADKLALMNARSRGELVEIVAVKRLGEKVMVAIRNRILNMPLTDDEKDRCLGELMGLEKIDWTREG
jgi:hypothetical protein